MKKKISLVLFAVIFILTETHDGYWNYGGMIMQTVLTLSMVASAAWAIKSWSKEINDFLERIFG